MHHDKITKTFLEYFKKHKHKIIQSAPLVPAEHDPSALFTNSGMHPLKPYFLGLKKPPAKKLANIQGCVRTVDIEKVGNKRSLTYFYMLGSWSIGDYWKETIIPLAWNLLVEDFKINPNKLYVTIFKGNKKVPKDAESEKIWLATGMPKKRIIVLGEKDNFWRSGPIGPCGPNTEINYDRGAKFGHKNCKPGCDCDRWLEIWNLVCMQYNCNEKGKLTSLPFKSIDTGAGLARMAALLQKKDSVYETTLFEPVLRKLEKLSRKKYSEHTKAMRIILDHLRACCFIISEGVRPSKVERGYILRRLLRRMIMYGRKLNLEEKDYLELASVTKEIYPKINLKQFNIIFTEEFRKFSKTLTKGLNRLNRIIRDKKVLSCEEAFKMYDTFGFPLELTKEICSEEKVKVDEKGFYKCFEKHKEISKGGAKQRFKSGLSIESDATIKLHTATHLLNTALRKVLKRDVHQKGSNITPDRLRFDFPSKEKLTPKQIKKVEDIVNKKIKESIPVKKEELTVAEAKKRGAEGIFEHKYGKKVTVYTIGDFSKEICAGPHVKNTSELGKFKIIKQESIGAGVRRIKATLTD